MNDWNEMVKLGMLGTEKAAFSPDHLPIALQSYLPTGAQADPEGDFLQAAALLLAYRRAGTQAASPPFPRLSPAPEEELPYVNNRQSAILRKLLDEDVHRNKALIALWLQHCAANKRIVTPDFLPDLLNFQSTFAHLPFFIEVLGKRGLWLSVQRTKWTLLETSPEKIWQEGSSAERNELIQHLWKNEPDQALQHIQEAWATANAKERLSWLHGLIGLRSDLALDFAEDLYQNLLDTGTKAKESLEQQLAITAAYLLSQPRSQLYQKISPSLQNLVKRNKGFLGLKEKTTLELPSTFDDFFNDKLAQTLGLSTEKGLSPAVQIKKWFVQMLTNVHPSCWEEVLGEDWRQIFPIFPPTYHVPLADALGKATHREGLKVFITLPLLAATSDEVLIELRKRDLLHHENSPFSRLRSALALLPQEELEKFIRSLDSRQLGYFYQSIPAPVGEWSLKISHLIYHEMLDPSKDQQGFQKYLLKEAWSHLHLGILPEMANTINATTGYSPEATIVYNYVKPLYNHLLIKQSILQAFTTTN